MSSLGWYYGNPAFNFEEPTDLDQYPFVYNTDPKTASDVFPTRDWYAGIKDATGAETIVWKTTWIPVVPGASAPFAGPTDGAVNGVLKIHTPGYDVQDGLLKIYAFVDGERLPGFLQWVTVNSDGFYGAFTWTYEAPDASVLFEDKFDGVAGPSSGHTPDVAPSGFEWQSFTGQLEIDGSGNLVNVTDNNSSATSAGSWSIPLPPAFQMQLDANMSDGETGAQTWAVFYIEAASGDDFLSIEVDRTSGGDFSIDISTRNGDQVIAFNGLGSHQYVLEVTAAGWTLSADTVQIGANAEDLSAMTNVAFMIAGVNATGGMTHAIERVALIAVASPPPPAGSSLPELIAPVELCYLRPGNPITPQSPYDDFAPMLGHDRKRRIWTKTTRVVSVAAILEERPAQVVDDWFENILEVGTDKFAARVAELEPGSKYWAAEWVAPPQWEPMALKRWRLTGQLLLTGEGEANPPSTVTLSLEFGLPLSATAAIFAPVELAIEFAAPLLAHNPFAFGFDLDLTYPARELREDGGHELREDSGIERRE